MPMKGNQHPGSNMKSFGAPKKIEKGSDPMPRSTGHCETHPMKMDLKEFNRTKSTACGVKK